LVHIAAKSHYMFGGAVSVPIVVRAVIGRSWGQGAQHSQGLQSLFMHIPGLRVVAPSTPYDAKGILVESIRDNNPVIFVEHRMIHSQKSHVPEEDYTVPLGKARVLTEGDDVTIVGISYMAVESFRAWSHLKDAGISAEVIDPVSLSPLDIDTIVESVKKTGRLIVVDCAWTSCGASAEIVAQVSERLEDVREIRHRRMGFAPVVCPTTKDLENLYYPDAQKIAAEAYSLVRGNGSTWMPEAIPAQEIVEFRGPF
jgi:pyruvate/2-oxoglutarate/acetoin dehydrogenase E1 component